jgi:hypothetical protein
MNFWWDPHRFSGTLTFRRYLGGLPKEGRNEPFSDYPHSQGCAQECKSRIFRGVPFSGLPRGAPYCVPGGIRLVSKARGSRVAGSLANHAHYHPLPTIKRAGVGVLVALPTLEARLPRAMTSRRSTTKGAKPHPGTDGQNWRPSVQSPFREKGTLPLSETIAHVHASQGGLRYNPCRSRGRHG